MHFVQAEGIALPAVDVISVRISTQVRLFRLALQSLLAVHLVICDPYESTTSALHKLARTCSPVCQTVNQLSPRSFTDSVRSGSSSFILLAYLS